MFVGHALFAFAVASLAADRRGWERRNALIVGAVAGAFAAVPDVDVAYALVGLAEWHVGDGALAASTAFWDASRVVHRSVTHSLIVGAIAAPAFGLLSVRGRSTCARLAHVVAIGLLGALLASAFVWDGALAALVMGLFLASGALVARGTARLSSLSPSTIGVAALWGLWSHPWGDFATGSPPDWSFPLETAVLQSRIVLHPDPTLHLLGAFGVELAVVWLALVTICHLTDRPLLDPIDRRAGASATYGIAALAGTPPTLETSYHFVFSILGVGLLCGAVRAELGPGRRRTLRDRTRSTDAVLEAVRTALAGVTVALVAYTATYALVGAPA